MAIEAKIIGDQAVADYLNSIPELAAKALQSEMDRQTAILQATVVGKLDGEVLKVGTGTLRRSINRRVLADSLKITGAVGTNLVYARVHELGGVFQIPEHTAHHKKSFSKQASSTAKSGYRKVYFKKHVEEWTVKAHEAHFPQRSFLMSSLKEKFSSITEGLSSALARVMHGEVSA